MASKLSFVTLAIAILIEISLSIANANDVSWVGYQFGPPGGMQNPWSYASFFHGDNWEGYTVPGAGDDARFVTSHDPQNNGMPTSIYFGSVYLPVIPIYHPNSETIPAGNASVHDLIMFGGNFDFHFTDYGGTTPHGSLTVNRWIFISGGTDATTAGLTVYGGPIDTKEGLIVGSANDGADGYGTFTSHGSSIIQSSTTAGGLRVNKGVLTLDDNSIFQGRFLQVGYYDGIANVRGGTHVTTSQNSTIGSNVNNNTVGAKGVVLLSGPGTRWDSASQIQIGSDNGIGKVTISNGAILSSSKGTSASESSGLLGLRGGSGEVLVTGNGSTWTQDGALSVGWTASGSGVLRVEDSGSVSSVDGFIGRNTTTTGSVTVTGSNSAWSATRSFYIGGDSVIAGGTGTLTVANHGLVSVANTFKMWPSSTVKVSDGGKINVGGGSLSYEGMVRVGTGGTFTGVGNIVGDVRNDGGLVSPGSSLGVLNINGSYQQLPGSQLLLEIGGSAPGSQYDQLSISGNMSIAGNLNIQFIGGYVPALGAKFDLASVGGTVDFSGANIQLIGAPANLSFVRTFSSGVFSLTATNAPSSIGDFDQNKTVDSSDYSFWRQAFGSAVVPKTGADASGDGFVDATDYIIWRKNFGPSTASGLSVGSVPEPNFLVWLAILVFGLCTNGRVRSSGIAVVLA